MNDDAPNSNDSDLDVLRQTLLDTENTLLTAIEHGDAIEAELLNTNQSLQDEILARVIAERRLSKVLDAIKLKNTDLELLIQTITEHSDDIDIQWLQRYASVETLSLTDQLTGLNNRRKFETILNDEWGRASRNDQSLALLMLDVDSFKAYNDHFGHPVGDKALKSIASVLSTACNRQGDWAARIGGEEFAVILSGADADGAMAIAEKIRDAIFGQNITHPKSPFGRLSVSIGVASLKPSQGDDVAKLIAEADRLLYVAKNGGRNCCCQASQSPTTALTPSVEVVGDPITIDEDDVMESLVLSFSPSLFTLQQRWRNNGLSADFLADYVTSFFPGTKDGPDVEARKAEFRGEVSYVANEILENAMKHSLNTLPYPITIRMILKENQILFVGTNTTSAASAQKFKAFVRKLASGDPAEIYMEILERSAESGESGLGLVTMINDYGANLAWEFECVSEDVYTVSTKVKINV